MAQEIELENRHIHEYVPVTFWQLDYDWLAVDWRCEGEHPLGCDNPAFIEAYVKSEKR